MILSIEGKIARAEWRRTETLRPYVRLDQFLIMPDHFHAIIHLCPPDVGERRRRTPTIERFGVPVKGSLGTIVRSFKSVVTRRINQLHRTKGAAVWQLNYYERVIRSEQELERIQRYIVENPLRWEEDRS